MTETAITTTQEDADAPERLPEGHVRITDKITRTQDTEGLSFPKEGYGDHYVVALCTAYGDPQVSWTSWADPETDMQRWVKDYERTSVHMMTSSVSVTPHDLYLALQYALNESPWARFDWWRINYLRWAEHVPQMSSKMPGLLSYYQSPEKRARGILTPIKPGKYLRKFFLDLLTEEQIQEHGIAWQTAATPPELHVSQDADEVESVYKGGPNSCMTFRTGGYAGSEHPARAYAGPDLAVAYIGDMNAAAGRAVVWPEKKLYGRVYGDFHRMGMALSAAGYTQAEDHQMLGARIQRLHDGGGTYCVPYCDFATYASDVGSYLIVDDRGGINLRETSGVNEQRASCGMCGDGMDEDDSYSTDSHGSVCSDCYSEHFFTCSVCEEAYPHDQLMASPDDHPISRNATRSRHYSDQVFFCQGTDMWYPTSAYDYTVLEDGTVWEQSYYDEHGFTSDHDMENYDLEEQVELTDGRTITEAQYDKLIREDDEWLDGAVRKGGTEDHPDQMELPIAVAA